MHCMYLDVFGLVTTAVGNLINSPRAATWLPWYRPDGEQASLGEIETEWRHVKALQKARGPAYYYEHTKLRLSDTAIDALVARRLARNVAQMRETFPDWGDWPADAQLATLSLCWAVGASLIKWPKFRAACLASDWEAAARESQIRTENNPGVVPRNERQVVCFMNALAVDQNSAALDKREVYWPLRLVPL
jgi:hypothetical protein